MTISRQALYAAGMPFGDSATRQDATGRRIYGGGGGGSSTSTSQIVYPDEIKPLLQNVADLSTDLYQTPFQAYNGQRFAGLNDIQQQALQGTINRAMQGSPLMDQANQTLSQLLGGQQSQQLGAANDALANVVQGGQQGPLRSAADQGLMDAMGGNPMQGAVNDTLTQMMQGGSNPYLDQQVQQAQQSVLDSYNMAVKPQTEAAMVGSGSFGNSGLQQMQGQQQNQLQQNLGNVATNMYGNAYAQDQANRLGAAGQLQSGIGQSLAGQLQAIGMAQGTSDQDLARQLQAIGMTQNQAGQDINSRLAALGLAPQFANQDYADLSQIVNVGNVLQDQAQNQADFSYDEFLRQQDDPFRKLQAMTGVMQGTAGSTTHTTQSGGK